MDMTLTQLLQEIVDLNVKLQAAEREIAALKAVGEK